MNPSTNIDDGDSDDISAPTKVQIKSTAPECSNDSLIADFKRVIDDILIELGNEGEQNLTELQRDKLIEHLNLIKNNNYKYLEKLIRPIKENLIKKKELGTCEKIMKDTVSFTTTCTHEDEDCKGKKQLHVNKYGTNPVGTSLEEHIKKYLIGPGIIRIVKSYEEEKENSQRHRDAVRIEKDYPGEAATIQEKTGKLKDTGGKTAAATNAAIRKANQFQKEIQASLAHGAAEPEGSEGGRRRKSRRKKKSKKRRKSRRKKKSKKRRKSKRKKSKRKKRTRRRRRKR